MAQITSIFRGLSDPVSTMTTDSTEKDPNDNHAIANVWYDELIVSRSFVGDQLRRFNENS